MIIQDWGVIDFREAWRRQRELVDAVMRSEQPDTLVLCEHPAVITLGRNTQPDSVVIGREILAANGIEVLEIDRGGDATVHDRGQLVGYPIFNLTRTKQDLHWFLRTMEQCIIDAISTFQVSSGRLDGLTGVWIEESRKICAIGIHCSRWVTSHGFAVNVNNDLSLFDSIIPCGIRERGVTSIQKELGRLLDLEEVKIRVQEAFRKNFGITP
ncbi:MAG: lipoyl(octanoyl) transferase LipB [Candidatus Kapabacteria bacterium]|nr:lipoyl(octanoyl) transferase LipB [Candidatus Kapabacteria bacterium]